jgi:hypothetical protein
MHYEQELTTFDQLSDDYKKLVVDGLKQELALSDEPKVDGILEFRKADIPLRGHDTHAKGKLAEFLQALFPDRDFKIVPLFRTLLSEVVVRNNNHEPNATYPDLLRHKALSRSRFTEVLQQAGVSDLRVEYQEIAQQLTMEKYPFPSLNSIRREWDAVQLDRLTKRDIPNLRLREIVKSSVAAHKSEALLSDIISKSYQDILPELRKERGFSEPYIKTYIAIEAYEHQ